MNTSGPWYCQHRMIQDGEGGSQRWHILAGSDRSIQICTLKGWDDEDEANARLIAAAPELLRACKIAHGFVADGDMPIDTPASVATILYQVIAKAEGK